MGGANYGAGRVTVEKHYAGGNIGCGGRMRRCLRLKAGVMEVEKVCRATRATFFCGGKKLHWIEIVLKKECNPADTRLLEGCGVGCWAV